MSKIAIAMATYNGEKFISDQIDSVLSQTYSDWVLYIHDDGSCDKTIDIIKKYTLLHPQKIIFLEDGEVFGSPIKNFSYTVMSIPDEYDYYMFSDQDDFWLPNKIEITLEKMSLLESKGHSDKPKLVHTDLIVANTDLSIISRSMWDFQNIQFRDNQAESLLARNNITGCTLMFDSHTKKRFFPIPEEALMHDWWLAVNVAHYGIIDYVSVSTIYYRQHICNSVGAKKVGLLYYLCRALDIKDIYTHYRDLNKMIEKLDFNVSLFRVLYLKLNYVAKSLFRI